MRQKLLLIGILIVAFSCNKENDDVFKYDYRIIRTQHSHDPRFSTSASRDSFIYYYDNHDRLLKTDVCWAKDIISSKYVEYSGDEIRTSYGIFVLNPDNKIIRFNYNLNQIQTFEYSNNRIYHMLNGQSEEAFYFYDNDALIKDSTIINLSNIESYISVNDYTNYDTLSSDFMINYYGLLEYPKLNNYLIKEVQTSFYDIYDGNIIRKGINTIKYKYFYSLSDTLIIEDIYTIEVLQDEVFEIVNNTYKIERK